MLSTNVGYELIEGEHPVRVTRFSKRIRLLHWFNAVCILTLYVLAALQLFEITTVPPQAADTRPLHVQTGLIWIMVMPCLLFLASLKNSNKRKRRIVSEKLVIKQQLFLWASVLFILVAGLTGLLLYLTQNIEIPAFRNLILAIHGLAAILYLPVLLFHIYLALFHIHSKHSLKTMFFDVYIEHLVHNYIPDLTCMLTDDEGIIMLKGEVMHMSISGFEIKIPEGNWEGKLEFSEFTHATFLHDELKNGAMIKVSLSEVFTSGGYVNASFTYPMSIQESAREILSHALFFQYLFLQQRKHPRLTCNYPVMLYTEQQMTMGLLVNLSLGGASVLAPIACPKNANVRLVLNLRNPDVDLELSGNIVLTEKASEHDYFYAVNFPDSNDEQLLNIKKILHYLNVNEHASYTSSK